MNPEDKNDIEGPSYTIKLMALLAELAEADQIVLAIEETAPMTAGDLKEILFRLPIFEEHTDLIQKSALAVNLEIAVPDTSIHPEDEIALLPPVSGG